MKRFRTKRGEPRIRSIKNLVIALTLRGSVYTKRHLEVFFSKGATKKRRISRPGQKLNPCHQSAGFTLLEILVALSLLGIAVVAIIQLFSVDLKSVSVSEGYVAGTLAAQSKMREVLSEENLSEKAWNEVSDSGYRFEVSIVDTMPERAETLSVKLLAIEVKVYWVQGIKEKSLTLKTLKMVQKQV